MAKKKKTEAPDSGTKQSPRRFDPCGPRGCSVAAVKGARIRTSNEVFTERGGKPFTYTTAAGPCGVDRNTCPVQLSYRQGQTYLRLCRQQPKNTGKPFVKSAIVGGEVVKYKRSDDAWKRQLEQPGWLIPVNSPEDAQDMAQAACKCWSKAKDGFLEVVQTAKKDAQGVVKTKQSSVWRGSFERCQVPAGAPVKARELGNAKGTRTNFRNLTIPEAEANLKAAEARLRAAEARRAATKTALTRAIDRLVAEGAKPEIKAAASAANDAVAAAEEEWVAAYNADGYARDRLDRLRRPPEPYRPRFSRY